MNQDMLKRKHVEQIDTLYQSNIIQEQKSHYVLAVHYDIQHHWNFSSTQVNQI